MVSQRQKGFPLVGSGASASGLTALFSGLPADTDPGRAFVLVRHLAPNHDFQVAKD